MAEEDSMSKRADQTLAQLRQKNELILGAAGEGIYGLDTQGKTTFVNPEANAALI